MLNFEKGKILFENEILRTKAYHRTKFSRNSSIHCKDIAIFQFMKMAAAAILNFRIRKILLADGVQRTKRHNRAKFFSKLVNPLQR